MSIRVTRVTPEKNMARWYEIDVQPTLFGEFTIERHWGRIGSSGQSKTWRIGAKSSAKQLIDFIYEIARTSD